MLRIERRPMALYAAFLAGVSRRWGQQVFETSEAMASGTGNSLGKRASRADQDDHPLAASQRSVEQLSRQHDPLAFMNGNDIAVLMKLCGVKEEGLSSTNFNVEVKCRVALRSCAQTLEPVINFK
jgi:hypothetical protein